VTYLQRRWQRCDPRNVAATRLADALSTDFSLFSASENWVLPGKKKKKKKELAESKERRRE